MSDESAMHIKVKSLEERVKKLEEAVFYSVSSSSVKTKTKKSSAREFLLTLSLKSDVQKAVALAYFLEYLEGMESFNVADLEKAFRAAKEKPPKNINDAVNKNIARGFLMDAAEKKDSKKAWCLTATGEQFVENDLKIK